MMEYTNSHPKQRAPHPGVERLVRDDSILRCNRRPSARKRSQSAWAGIQAPPGRETDSAVEVSLARA